MTIWNPGMKLRDIEKSIIEKAVSFFRTREKAAQSLGITLKDIEKKLKRYEEEKEELELKKYEIREKEEEFVRKSRGIRPSI